MSCLNRSIPIIDKLAREFGEVRTSILLERHHNDAIPKTYAEFFTKGVREDLGIIKKTEAFELLGKKFGSKLTETQLKMLKITISKFNDRNPGTVLMLTNMTSTGPNAYRESTYDIIKVRGRLDVEAKAQRARDRAVDPSQRISESMYEVHINEPDPYLLNMVDKNLMVGGDKEQYAGNISRFLEMVLMNRDVGPNHKALATILLNNIAKNPDLKIKYIPEDLTSKPIVDKYKLSGKTLQFYNPESNTVVMGTNSISVSEHKFIATTLHELIHGFTVYALMNPKTLAEKEFSQTMKKIYEAAKANAAEDVRLGIKDEHAPGMYGYKNVKEFVSEMVTNAEFVKEIKSLTKERTILQQIVDAILKLFKINRRSYGDSVYQQSKEAIENFLNHSDVIDTDLTGVDVNLLGISELQQEEEDMLSNHPDDRLNKKPVPFKLQQANDDVARIITKAHSSADIRDNQDQQRTIAALLEGVEANRELNRLNAERDEQGLQRIHTIASSRYTGISEFNSKGEYEDFKHLGIFTHDFVDFLQTNSDKKILLDYMSRELFQQKLDEYRNGTKDVDGKVIEKGHPFQIDSLTDDEMYKFTREVVSFLGSFPGSILIPEITVAGKTVTGENIICRLDLVVINTLGELTIIDFKTKKIGSPTPGIEELNMNSINAAMIRKSVKTSQTVGTAPPFQLDKRSTIDSWNLQMQVYENILRQHKVNVKDKVILGLFYQTHTRSIGKDSDGRDVMAHDYQGFKVQDFNTSRLYDYAATTVPSEDLQDNHISNVSKVEWDKTKAVIDKLIPISDEQKQQADGNQSRGIFNTTEQEYLGMADRMQVLIDKEMRLIEDRLKELEGKDPALIQSQQDRKTTLKTFQDVLKSGGDWVGSVKLYTIKNRIEEDIKLLYDNMETANKIVAKTPEERRDKTNKMLMYYSNASSIRPIFVALQRIVEKEMASRDAKMDSKDQIFEHVKKIDSQISHIETLFRGNYATIFAEMIMQTYSAETFRRVNEQRKLAVLPILEYNRKRLEALMNGAPTSLTNRIKLRWAKVTGNEAKFKKDWSANDNLLEAEIRSLEELIIKQEFIVNTGIEYSVESIRKYVEAVTNESSDFYIGMSGSITNNFGIAADDYIATASNSDLGLSALVNMYKQAETDAFDKMQNRFEVMKIHELVAKAVEENGGLEETNNAISEWVTVKAIVDGKLTEKRVKVYTSPYTTEYTDHFSTYYFNSKQKYKEIEDLTTKLRTSVTQAEIDVIKADLSKKRKEREDLLDEHLAFQVKYCQLEFIPEYYEYLKKIPSGVRADLQAQYLEQQLIMGKVGRNSTELLSEADFEALNAIDIVINRIKQDAINSGESEVDREQYALYLELGESIYEWQTDHNAFNRAYNKAEIDYATSPELWAKWKKINMVTVPSKKWYEEGAKLYERLQELTGDDPVMQQLLEDRRRIKRVYKHNAKFDPRDLTTQDLAKLDQIESTIEGLLSNKRSIADVVHPDNLAEATELIGKISSRSKNKINDLYDEEFSKRHIALERKRLTMEASKVALEAAVSTDANFTELQKKFNFDYSQFILEEQDFAKWYNDNHKNEYTPQTATTGIQKAFWFDKVPIDDSNPDDWERNRPTNKWNKRVIKEDKIDPETGEIIKGARNKDYQEAPGGIPLPNNVRYVEAKDSSQQSKYVVTRDNIKDGANKFINEKYTALTNKPATYELFNKLRKEMTDMEKRTYGESLANKIPGFLAHTVDDVIARGPVAGVGDYFKRSWDDSMKPKAETDLASNEFGDRGPDFVKHRGNRQFSEGLQSEDTINCSIMWLVEAYKNEALYNVKPMSDTIIKGMKLQAAEIPAEQTKRRKEYDEAIGVAEYEANKALSGITQAPGASKVARKALQSIFSIASFGRIAFDIANQTKNMVSGNIQLFLSADKSAKFSLRALAVAKRDMYSMTGLQYHLIKDWGKISGYSMETMMFRKFNPLQIDSLKYYDQTTGSRMRRALSKLARPIEVGYFLQDKGDAEIGMTVYRAIMEEFRFPLIDPVTKQVLKDEKGDDRTITAYECYIKDIDTGQLMLRNDVKYTKDDESQIQRLVRSEIRRTQGNYASSDAPKASSTIMGQLLLFYKKYLIPQVLNRLGDTRPDWEAAGVSRGYWRVMLDVFKYWGWKDGITGFALGGFAPGLAAKLYSKEYKGKDAQGEAVHEFYRSKSRAASKEVVLVIIMTTIAMMLKSMWTSRDKDDDDEIPHILAGNLIRVYWGAVLETRSLSPLPVFGGIDEYTKTFTNFTNLGKEFEAINKTFTHLLAGGFSAGFIHKEPSKEDDFMMYQIWKAGHYVKDTGPYEAGDYKVSKDLIDLSGYRNMRDIFSPQNKLINTQKFF